ncbi:DUF905 family protein [Raoultella planticola]
MFYSAIIIHPVAAEVVSYLNNNMPLEDCKHIHFSPAIRCSESWMVWRAWCFEPDAGEGLNRYILQYSILRASSS